MNVVIQAILTYTMGYFHEIEALIKKFWWG